MKKKYLGIGAITLSMLIALASISGSRLLKDAESIEPFIDDNGTNGNKEVSIQSEVEIKDDTKTTKENSDKEQDDSLKSQQQAKDVKKTQESTIDSSNNTNPSSDASPVLDNSSTTAQTKERTVTVKTPIYGPQYTDYWIKDDDKVIIFETKDPNQWNEKLDEYANQGVLTFYGSEGKSDIIGYNTYVYTESEYYEVLEDSDLGSRKDVIVVWN
ncbi:MAG: hypothetical protein PUE18_03390 [Firmicutes bacterium]|nr:hypothetical protein [Bacillota bacterium]